MGLPFFSHKPLDAAWLNELATEQYGASGFVAFCRTNHLAPTEHQKMTRAILAAGICYIVADPEDVKSDTLFLYVLGVANAAEVPVSILSSTPTSEWPEEISSKLATIVYLPEIRKIRASGLPKIKHRAPISASDAAPF